MDRNDTFDQITSEIEQDREELVNLCLDLGNTASPHGKERRVGEKVLDWLKANGIPGFLQFITEESVNAVGTISRKWWRSQFDSQRALRHRSRIESQWVRSGEED